MSAPAAALLTGALVVAVVDWWAVGTDRRAVELVAKPTVLVLLVACACVLDAVDVGQQAWFVAALILSLVGDVLLLFPRRGFAAGLGAFLLGHVCYVVGFWARGGGGPVPLLVGVALVLVAMATLGRRIVRAVSEGPDRELTVPVAFYIGVISAMVASAFGIAVAVAIVGSLLFYASDALLAWNRFVEPLPGGRVAVMVTYHLAQVGLVLSLR